MVRPAISNARPWAKARRSTGPWRAASSSRSSAPSAAERMCGASAAVARGAKAGARVRRCRRQAAPSLSTSPSPISGRSMRMVARVRP